MRKVSDRRLLVIIKPNYCMRMGWADGYTGVIGCAAKEWPGTSAQITKLTAGPTSRTKQAPQKGHNKAGAPRAVCCGGPGRNVAVSHRWAKAELWHALACNGVESQPSWLQGRSALSEKARFHDCGRRPGKELGAWLEGFGGELPKYRKVHISRSCT
jgi:hypothetical protein